MSNVLRLADTTLCNSQQDVVDRIRDMADQIERGEWGNVNLAIVLVETKDGKLSHRTIGAPCDMARVVGLLHIESVRACI